MDSERVHGMQTPRSWTWTKISEAGTRVLANALLAGVVRESTGRREGERDAPASEGREETARRMPETGPLRRRGPAEIEMERALIIRHPRKRKTSGAAVS